MSVINIKPPDNLRLPVAGNAVDFIKKIALKVVLFIQNNIKLLFIPSAAHSPPTHSYWKIGLLCTGVIIIGCGRYFNLQAINPLSIILPISSNMPKITIISPKPNTSANQLINHVTQVVNTPVRAIGLKPHIERNLKDFEKMISTTKANNETLQDCIKECQEFLKYLKGCHPRTTTDPKIKSCFDKLPRTIEIDLNNSLKELLTSIKSLINMFKDSNLTKKEMEQLTQYFNTLIEKLPDGVKATTTSLQEYENSQTQGKNLQKRFAELSEQS